MDNITATYQTALGSITLEPHSYDEDMTAIHASVVGPITVGRFTLSPSGDARVTPSTNACGIDVHGRTAGRLW